MPFYDSHDLHGFLDRLTSRSILTAAERQAILNLPCHVAAVQANRDFVGLTEKVAHATLVVDGLVGRFDQSVRGARQITAIHIAGDMANLHSVVQPEAISALQALSTATVLRIPHAAIRAIATAHPAIAEALWRDCVVDAAILSQWVLNVGRRDAKCRLAHLLCEMATRFGVVSNRGAFSVPFAVTQFQLADATGLTPVHVNRVIRALREENVADMRHREVMVFDWHRLVAIGDFDAGYLQANIRPEEKLRMVQAC